MQTKTITLYTFDELSDDAKDKAREWWRECESQDFGSDTSFLYEPIETAAKLLGIDLTTRPVKLMGGGTRYDAQIFWTLHVQGAGASFEGTYSYAKGSVKAIAKEFPQDTELQRIAAELQAIQKRYQYSLTARISSRGNGHYLEVDIDHASDVEETMRECFKDFAHWIYKYIDEEYNYRMADTQVDDAILANEYTFTESGRRDD